MSRTRIAFHDISFEVATRLEARAPHDPTVMMSGNSKGPVKMWVCGRPKCNEVRYTYTSHAAPVCTGGMFFSFTTQTPFDPRVHAERARFV